MATITGVENQSTDRSLIRAVRSSLTKASQESNLSQQKIKVLVVEDELEIRRILKELLEAQGFAVETLSSGNAIIHQLDAHTPQALLVDQMMPGLSGTEVIKLIRAEERFQNLPIIMVTALTGEEEKVFALDLGADDYVTKPFQARELGARIHAVVRRSMARQNVLPKHEPTTEASPGEVGELRQGPIRVELRSYRAFVGDQELHLTLTEYKILLELLRQSEDVLTREQLRDRALEGAHVTDRTIDVHMASLRKKLGAPGELIETVRGVGYRMGRAVTKA